MQTLVVEMSTAYPLLMRYAYCWEWVAHVRVYKPQKQKKEWLDSWHCGQGNTVEEARRSLESICFRKGFTLLEVLYLRPTLRMFSYDRDNVGRTLTPAEIEAYCPKPDMFGTPHPKLLHFA